MYIKVSKLYGFDGRNSTIHTGADKPASLSIKYCLPQPKHNLILFLWFTIFQLEPKSHRRLGFLLRKKPIWKDPRLVGYERTSVVNDNVHLFSVNHICHAQNCSERTKFCAAVRSFCVFSPSVNFNLDNPSPYQLAYPKVAVLL